MKKYSFEAVVDGKKIKIEAINEGFNVLEIAGLFALKLIDISKQMEGIVKPEHIRKFIEESEANVDV